jgi:hypothetical protein
VPCRTAALSAFSPTFPVAQRHAADRRNLEADLPPVWCYWSARGLRGPLAEILRRGSTPPQRGHVMPELTRDMRQMCAFSARSTTHKNTAAVVGQPAPLVRSRAALADSAMRISRRFPPGGGDHWFSQACGGGAAGAGPWNSMLMTGCNSIALGATPSWPWAKSKKPSPRTVTDSDAWMSAGTMAAAAK